MPKRTKLPDNPNPSIYGNPPQLDLPEGIFDGIKHDKYSSKYFDDRETLDYFKGIYQEVRENGKGRVLFTNEDLFLNALDDSLLHFDIFRDCVSVTDDHSFNAQRDYFKALNTAASKLNDQLCKMDELHLTRLAHAGFELRQFSKEQRSSHDLRANIKALTSATEEVQIDLKGKNAGRFAELYLLIEQLGEMYHSCSGIAPSVTGNLHNPGSKGVFFKLIKSVLPHVHLENAKFITDSSIVEGIKLLKK